MRQSYATQCMLVLGVAVVVTLGATPGKGAEELTELEDVVVTGTRTEQKLSEVPVRTEVIKREEIEDTGARTLADAVEFTTGVRVENSCQNCNFQQLRLLGLEGPYSQVLIDGQPLLSSLASVYGLEHIPARMIERIEIVKGGGSALYGPGAVAGVVNVITRDPIESGAEVEATYARIDDEPSTSFNAVGDLVSRDGNTRLSVMGQTDQRDGYDRDGDGFTEVGERDLDMLGVRLRHFFTEDIDVTLECNHVYEDRRGGDSLDEPEHFALVAEAVQTTRDAGSVTWSHAVSDGFDYRLTGSFAITDRDSYYGAGRDPNAYGNTDNPLYNVDTQFNHYFGPHTVSWGGQFSYEGLDDEQAAYNRKTDDEYTNAGFYVQDDWQLFDTLSLVLGARVDKHSELDEAVFSPRVAVKWEPFYELTLRASYASGFRAPQVFDEDLHITQVGGEGQVIRNDDNLDEEDANSFSLGAVYMPQVGPGTMLLECNGFYTDIDDSFSLDERDDPATPEAEFYRINRDGAKVYGAEFNIGYQYEYYEFLLGYVHQESEFDDEDDDFGSDEFYRTPDDYGVMRFTYRNPELFDLFIGAKYTGEMKVPHYAGFIAEDRLEDTEDFLTFDVSLAKAFPVGPGDLTCTLGCKNITDEYQDDLDEGPDRDAGYVYGPRFPRTVYVSAKYHF